MTYKLRSITTGETYPADEIRYRADDGGLLEVEHDFSRVNLSKDLLNTRLNSTVFPYQSGVWRYRELVLPAEDKYIITRCEGNTNLYPVGQQNAHSWNYTPILGEYVGLDYYYIKHLGENPTGSFKDVGMTVAVTKGRMLGCEAVACASTGNTSAALASYAALGGMRAYVFIPEGKIAYGKLSQSLAYGAKTIQIRGDFDDAMRLVEEISLKEGIYLVNSINPFRIEGQKTIAYEIIQQLNWDVPDWIVLPGGNLGNTSALWKGIVELQQLGFIRKRPRIACIQADGANPFFQSFLTNFDVRFTVKAETLATAIKIGNPVSFLKAARAITESKGVVTQVTDQEIMDAKAKIDATGLGCEPASACSVAGTKKLVEEGIIKRNERVVSVVTGHILKDPDATIHYHLRSLENIKSNYANAPIEVEATLKGIQKAL